jgi:hypothetical protein
VRIGIAPPYGWEWEAIDFLTRVGIATNDAAGVATNINNLVINAKNHGWWNVCEAIYPMVGGNITNYCEDLRANPGWPITWHNATWSSNGVVFNGTSAYGDTLFNPSSSTPISSIGTNSTHLFAYVYSGTYANGATFIGCQEGSFLYYNLSLYPDPNYATTNIFTYGLFGLANYSPTINTGGDIRGPMMISKNSAVKEIAYCRALTNTTPQQTVVMIYQGLPNCTITVGARNTTTTVASFFNGTIAGATFGASVPHAAAVNMIADWNTFQQKLGRKVP